MASALQVTTSVCSDLLVNLTVGAENRGVVSLAFQQVYWSSTVWNISGSLLGPSTALSTSENGAENGPVAIAMMLKFAAKFGRGARSTLTLNT